MKLVLAPLRGVTIRCFRETFAKEIAAAGFTEAITPFIAALPGVDPIKDRELRRKGGDASRTDSFLHVTPQFIGKDPVSFGNCLKRISDAGYDTADLNCGCPFPMVRNKGRGCGLLRTPDALRRMLDVGCATMGEGMFSIKTRLGVDRPDELLELMPLINAYPLRFLTVHARTARQMYDGRCDAEALERVCASSRVPIVVNGDIPFPPPTSYWKTGASSSHGEPHALMIGRSFVRSLGERSDASVLALRYLEASKSELCGDRPVLGRMKELIAYWKDLPQWSRTWRIVKLCHTLGELADVLHTN